MKSLMAWSLPRTRFAGSGWGPFRLDLGPGLSRCGKLRRDSNRWSQWHEYGIILLRSTGYSMVRRGTSASCVCVFGVFRSYAEPCTPVSFHVGRSSRHCLGISTFEIHFRARVADCYKCRRCEISLLTRAVCAWIHLAKFGV